MSDRKSKESMMGLGVITALASSLCCITPLAAILAGSGSLASTFQWIEPLRPWLIGVTVLTLAVAWYLQLNPQKVDDCDCEVVPAPFWKGKKFLGIVTVFSALMLSFPLYAGVFYPNNSKEITSDVTSNTIQLVEFEVEGMTCTGCEEHVEYAVNELSGIINVAASFENSAAIVTYDPDQTDLTSIKEAIASTSYKVGEYQKITTPTND